MLNLRKYLAPLITTCVCLWPTMPALAEVFTWVDDKGAKHFGDTIPLEYRDQSEVVTIEIRQPSKRDIQRAKQKNRASQNWVNSNFRDPVIVDDESANDSAVPEEKKYTSAEEYNLMSYEEQQAAYAVSERCYAKCAGSGGGRGPQGAPSYAYSPNGVMYDNRSYRSGGRAGGGDCSHCGDILKKPRKPGSGISSRN